MLQRGRRENPAVLASEASTAILIAENFAKTPTFAERDKE